MRLRNPRIFLLAPLLSASAVLLGLSGGSGTPAAQARSYLGFDLNEYPGDDALPVLRKTFSFSSYWLSPPPEGKRSNWLGKRSILKSQGFGFVVLFNGRVSRNLKSVADGKAKGTLDAGTAAGLARREGFPAGTVLFLDIEEGGRLSAAYHAYVSAWIDALAKANYRCGAYCSGISLDEGGGQSISSAKDLEDHLAGRRLILWVFNDVCPPSPGCVFPEDPPTVADSGIPAAALWQYAQSPRRKERTGRCSASYAPDGNCYAPGDRGHQWLLDANVADSPDPSAPK